MLSEHGAFRDVGRLWPFFGAGLEKADSRQMKFDLSVSPSSMRTSSPVIDLFRSVRNCQKGFSPN